MNFSQNTIKLYWVDLIGSVDEHGGNKSYLLYFCTGIVSENSLDLRIVLKVHKTQMKQRYL